VPFICGTGAKTIKIGQKSPETIALRQKVSASCEKLIWDFFESGGQVVIYDANNGTRAARQTLAEKFDKANIHVVMLGQFIFLLADQNRRNDRQMSTESLCDNKEIIETNIRNVKISSPDVCASLRLHPFV
jgi:6-phosphofructo-2-kinase/fructose-2,6-biphosphatase 4